MPEELRSRIFHAYAQAASSETPVHDGTGLGFSITKKLVELYGGEIEMNSVIGQGSAFTFTIPLPSGTGESEAGGTTGRAGPDRCVSRRYGLSSLRQGEQRRASSRRERRFCESPVDDQSAQAGRLSRRRR
ncbi:hypothetical protein IDH45_14190 [Paenibacillus sp. IB182363]|uniref:histidine kinase n=1 Tax=Paenibacillus oceani TaxID=2772510 RepID=A0A927CAJ8_9BACL|nr:hypothetical protein [Paenibacillus oceani]